MQRLNIDNFDIAFNQPQFNQPRSKQLAAISPITTSTATSTATSTPQIYGYGGGSKVLLACGRYKKLSDIVPGDMIINLKGRPALCIRLVHIGRGGCRQVEHQNWYKSTNISHESLLWAPDNSPEKRCTWRNLREITSAFAGDTPINSITFPRELYYDIPYVNNITIKSPPADTFTQSFKNYFCPQITYKCDARIGYLLGAYVATGDIIVTNDNTCGVFKMNFDTHRANVVRCGTLINSLFDVVPTQTTDTNTATATVISTNKKLVDVFTQLNVSGVPHPVITPQVFSRDDSFLQALRDGIFDNLPRTSRSDSFYDYIREMTYIFNHLKRPTMSTMADPNSESLFMATATLKYNPMKNNQFMNSDTINLHLKSVSGINIVDDLYNLEISDATHGFVLDNMIVRDITYPQEILSK